MISRSAVGARHQRIHCIPIGQPGTKVRECPSTSFLDSPMPITQGNRSTYEKGGLMSVLKKSINRTVQAQDMFGHDTRVRMLIQGDNDHSTTPHRAFTVFTIGECSDVAYLSRPLIRGADTVIVFCKCTRRYSSPKITRGSRCCEFVGGLTV